MYTGMEIANLGADVWAKIADLLDLSEYITWSSLTRQTRAWLRDEARHAAETKSFRGRPWVPIPPGKSFLGLNVMQYGELNIAMPVRGWNIQPPTIAVRVGEHDTCILDVRFAARISLGELYITHEDIRLRGEGWAALVIWPSRMHVPRGYLGVMRKIAHELNNYNILVFLQRYTTCG
jgi:hypothetical protein